MYPRIGIHQNWSRGCIIFFACKLGIWWEIILCTFEQKYANQPVAHYLLSNQSRECPLFALNFVLFLETKEEFWKRWKKNKNGMQHVSEKGARMWDQVTPSPFQTLVHVSVHESCIYAYMYCDLVLHVLNHCSLLCFLFNNIFSIRRQRPKKWRELWIAV